MRKLDCFEFCHLQIGDQAYYTVQDSDTILHKMSPRNNVTPDVIELAAKENVIVLGTRPDGFIVKQRGVEKRVGEKDISKINKAQGVEEGKDNCDTNGKENSDDGDSADDEYEDVEDEFSDKEESDGESSSHSRHDSPNPRQKKRISSYHKRKNNTKKGRKGKSRRAEREVKPGERVPVEIWYTFTYCDIMWQVNNICSIYPANKL